MMKLLTLLTTTAFTTATRLTGGQLEMLEQPFFAASHRELSGDMTYDDDFWNYNKDVDVSSQTIWTDYNYLPTKCMI